ncbi:hypothetical protein IMY05_C4746000100 [Salix suchowensis]|nr:hypothetical protein IMY05_C4746000100 [Salix suchowensis]
MSLLPQVYSSPASESDTDAPFVGGSNSPVEPATPEPLAATVDTDAAANAALSHMRQGTQGNTGIPHSTSESYSQQRSGRNVSAFIGESQPPLSPSRHNPELVESTTTATVVTDLQWITNMGRILRLSASRLHFLSSQPLPAPCWRLTLPYLVVYPPPPDYKNMGLPVCTPVPPRCCTLVSIHQTIKQPLHEFPYLVLPFSSPYTMPYNVATINRRHKHGHGNAKHRSIEEPGTPVDTPHPVPAARGVLDARSINQTHTHLLGTCQLMVPPLRRTLERWAIHTPHHLATLRKDPLAPVKAKVARRLVPMRLAPPGILSCSPRSTPRCVLRKTEIKLMMNTKGPPLLEKAQGLLKGQGTGTRGSGMIISAQCHAMEVDMWSQHRYPHPKVPGGLPLSEDA